jgi:hypothetical protein
LLLEKLSKPCVINKLAKETEVVREKDGNCHRRGKANRTCFIGVKNPKSARRRKKKKRRRVIHRNDIPLQQAKQWLLTAKGVLSTVLRLD